MHDLDIIIPVYNEGENIVAVLDSLGRSVKTPFRVMICYDDENDDTLPVINRYQPLHFRIDLVKNQGRGVHAAVVTGFDRSHAKAVLVLTADDTHGAGLVDQMVGKFKQGSDLVAASRFRKGGCMKGCRWPKAILARTASFTLHWFARVPITDATNGFRLFSRKVLDNIFIESKEGFTYSLELLAKCHRLGWRMDEVPTSWFERAKGKSRFRTFKWIPHYLRWYFYIFGTTYLEKPPSTVKLKAERIVS